MKAPSSFVDVRADLTDEQQQRLGEVLDAYLSDLEQGKVPSVQDICEQHPDLRQAIEHYVAGLQWLHQAADEANNAERKTQHRSPLESALPEFKQLGDYELLREIGRGGMGVVYEASQVSLHRRVALKVLPFAAVLDKKQITRFLNEAQAAAGLNHPHIVPVYGVGSDRGTYFYSMQFIDGRSLEQLIADLRDGQDADILPVRPQTRTASDAERNSRESDSQPAGKASSVQRETKRDRADSLTVRSIESRNYIRQIVELGIQAASAIEHAHSSGIIHRDIKPSNLLLDAEGKLWITDFGLAHCRRTGSHAPLDLTRSGDLIGTLRYMSPEQASGSNDWIDGRTDVYALGATLYELLTLAPIIDAENRITMLRQIEAGIFTSPRKLNRFIPPDLENVLLKSLAHDREDRYQSAAAFKADLERFLLGRPVVAKRLSMLDRSARWISRRAKAVIAVVAALVLLLLGSAWTLSTLAAKNRQIADAGVRAEKHLQVANDVVFNFNERVLAELEELPGSDQLQADLARQAIDYCEAFAEYAQDDKSMDIEAGRALMMAARLENQFDRSSAALNLFHQASERLERAAKGSFGLTPDLVLARNFEASQLSKQNKIAEASRLLESTLEEIRQTAAQHAPVPKYASELLHINHASTLALQGNTNAALEEIREVLIELDHRSTDRSVESSEKKTGPADDDLLRQLLRSLLSLGQQSFLPDKVAADVLNESLSLAQDRLLNRPEDREAAYDFASVSAVSGAWHSTRSSTSEHSDTDRHRTEASDRFHTSIRTLQSLVDRAPYVLRYRTDLAGAHNNLGQLELERRSFSAALHAFDEARRQLEVSASQTDNYLIQSRLGGVYNNLALAAEGLGQLQTAAAHLRGAIAAQQAALAKNPDCTSCREFLQEHRQHLERVTAQLQADDSAKTDGSP